MVSSLEYLVITTLEELADPTEITNKKGEIPPAEDNFDIEGEVFQFSYKEHHNCNEYFNSEEEGSSDLEEEEEEGYEYTVDAYLDWMA